MNKPITSNSKSRS